MRLPSFRPRDGRLPIFTSVLSDSSGSRFDCTKAQPHSHSCLAEAFDNRTWRECSEIAGTGTEIEKATSQAATRQPVVQRRGASPGCWGCR